MKKGKRREKKKLTSLEKIQLHINKAQGRPSPNKLPRLSNEEYLVYLSKLTALKNVKIGTSGFGAGRANVFPQPILQNDPSYPQVPQGMPIDLPAQITTGYDVINGQIIPAPLPSAFDAITGGRSMGRIMNTPDEQNPNRSSQVSRFGMHEGAGRVNPQMTGMGGSYSGGGAFGNYQARRTFRDPEYIGPDIARTPAQQNEERRQARQAEALDEADRLREEYLRRGGGTAEGRRAERERPTRAEQEARQDAEDAEIVDREPRTMGTQTDAPARPGGRPQGTIAGEAKQRRAGEKIDRLKEKKRDLLDKLEKNKAAIPKGSSRVQYNARIEGTQRKIDDVDKDIDLAEREYKILTERYNLGSFGGQAYPESLATSVASTAFPSPAGTPRAVSPVDRPKTPEEIYEEAVSQVFGKPPEVNPYPKGGETMTIKIKRKAPKLKLPDDVLARLQAEQGIQDQSQFNVMEGSQRLTADERQRQMDILQQKREGRRMDETEEEFQERKKRELNIQVPDDE